MGGQLSFETFSFLFFLVQALVLLFYEQIKKKNMLRVEKMATLMTPFMMGRVVAAERPLNGCRSCSLGNVVAFF